MLGMIDEYDPDDGNTRTLRNRTPEGGCRPKRVWFFEKLRLVNDEPESLPEEIPQWSLDILEKINNANKTGDHENNHLLLI